MGQQEEAAVIRPVARNGSSNSLSYFYQQTEDLSTMSHYLKAFGWIVGVLIVIGLLGFITIQFVPVERTNPPVVSEPKWDSPQTRALAERACFDCHSNETKWPWYSQVAPVSWLITDDVYEGRAALNFSEWDVNRLRQEAEHNEKGEDEAGEGAQGQSDQKGKAVEPDETIEEVKEGKMPLFKYMIMHPEARLNKAESQALIAGLKATLGAEGAQVK
jgi:hypothetical protein